MIKLKNKWTNEIREFKDGKNISIELGLENSLLKENNKLLKEIISLLNNR